MTEYVRIVPGTNIYELKGNIESVSVHDRVLTDAEFDHLRLLPIKSFICDVEVDRTIQLNFLYVEIVTVRNLIHYDLRWCPNLRMASDLTGKDHYIPRCSHGYMLIDRSGFIHFKCPNL